MTRRRILLALCLVAALPLLYNTAPLRALLHLVRLNRTARLGAILGCVALAGRVPKRWQLARALAPIALSIAGASMHAVWAGEGVTLNLIQQAAWSGIVGMGLRVALAGREAEGNRRAP